MYQFAAAMLYVLLLFLLAAVIYLLENIPAVLSWRDVDKTCTNSHVDSGGSSGAGSNEDWPGSMIGAPSHEYSSLARAVADSRGSGGPA